MYTVNQKCKFSWCCFSAAHCGRGRRCYRTCHVSCTLARSTNHLAVIRRKERSSTAMCSECQSTHRERLVLGWGEETGQEVVTSGGWCANELCYNWREATRMNTWQQQQQQSWVTECGIVQYSCVTTHVGDMRQLASAKDGNLVKISSLW